MPIYEYRCERCENVDEMFVSLSSDEQKSTVMCSKCGCTSHKIISMTSFRLIGDCWANDGYSCGTKGGDK